MFQKYDKIFNIFSLLRGQWCYQQKTNLQSPAAKVFNSLLESERCHCLVCWRDLLNPGYFDGSFQTPISSWSVLYYQERGSLSSNLRHFFLVILKHSLPPKNIFKKYFLDTTCMFSKFKSSKTPHGVTRRDRNTFLRFIL